MNSAKSKIPEAQYMLIIEGQSSKDYYTRNYELSYERALALIKFWSSNGIEFDSQFQEVDNQANLEFNLMLEGIKITNDLLYT